MTTLVPRVVLAYRPTEWDLLIGKHGTPGQARFFLDSRGRDAAAVRVQHQLQVRALREVENAVPRSWARTRVQRTELPNFLFEARDIVVAVGQDGLVPNLARYVAGLPVIGVNPDPDRYEGTLVRTEAAAAADLLAAVGSGRARFEEMTMVEARVDDGQSMVALNEIYVGHQTHQSARYRLECEDGRERQSSSGVIVATGTGATGWARSIISERASSLSLPRPTDRRLVFFVREAWPSINSGTRYTEGAIEVDSQIRIISEIEDGGVVFGDGLEHDRLVVRWGQEVSVGVAQQTLRLVAA